MSQQIDAIYDSGILRPLEPLALPDQARVKVTVENKQAVEPMEKANGANNADRSAGGTRANASDTGFDEELEPLLFDGPCLPADFSRADVYTDHRGKYCLSSRACG